MTCLDSWAVYEGRHISSRPAFRISEGLSKGQTSTSAFLAAGGVADGAGLGSWAVRTGPDSEGLAGPTNPLAQFMAMRRFQDQGSENSPDLSYQPELATTFRENSETKNTTTAYLCPIMPSR